MISKLVNTIKNFNLIQPDDTVIVALSGGADSVSLLCALNSLSESLSFTLCAAHLNHNIRGDEALRDQNFCQDLCLRLNIPLDIKSVNVNKTAETEKISSELAGRKERYVFFEELSNKYKNVKIATAHTASDNLETVIFNLTRGTGIDGLRGIPIRRGNIIRPLLEVTREEIENFCKKNSISYVTDSTNLQNIYNRNKIRNCAVPVLKQINPSVENAVLRMSMQMTRVSQYLDKQAEAKAAEAKTDYGYLCKILASAEKILCESVILNIAEKSGINNLEEKHIDLCRRIIYNGGAVSLPNGYYADSKQGIFRIIKEKTEKEQAEKFKFSLPVNENINFDFAGKNYSCSFSSCYEKNAKKEENEKYIIPLADSENLVLRTRKSGDTFSLKNRNVTKSLKKLLNEQKIPSELRDSLLMVEQNGKILWLEKIGISSYAQNNFQNAKLFLKITIIHHINNI